MYGAAVSAAANARRNTSGPGLHHAMLQLMSSRDYDSIIPRSRLPASDCAAEQQPAVDGTSMACTLRCIHTWALAALEMSMAHCAPAWSPQGSAHLQDVGCWGRGDKQ